MQRVFSGPSQDFLDDFQLTLSFLLCEQARETVEQAKESSQQESSEDDWEDKVESWEDAVPTIGTQAAQAKQKVTASCQ